jgi:hypothetical protein
MIKFNFTLDDFDTETLFSCIHQEVCKCHEDILERLTKGHKKEEDTYIQWYVRRITYLENLKKKIQGDRIPDEDVEEETNRLLTDFYKIPRYDIQEQRRWVQEHMVINVQE